MLRIGLIIAGCLAVAACDNTQGRPLFGDPAFGGPQLISGKSPPSPWANSSEPEPVNSLPRGAEGLGASGPNARFPNAGAITVRSPI